MVVRCPEKPSHLEYLHVRETQQGQIKRSFILIAVKKTVFQVCDKCIPNINAGVIYSIEPRHMTISVSAWTILIITR